MHNNNNNSNTTARFLSSSPSSHNYHNNNNKVLSSKLKTTTTTRKSNNNNNKNKVNFNVPKINISDTEDNLIYTTSTEINNKTTQSAKKQDLKTKAKKKKHYKSNYSDDSDDERDTSTENDDDILMEPPAARVDRFLSIVDIPEATLFKGGNSFGHIGEEDEEELEETFAQIDKRYEAQIQHQDTAAGTSSQTTMAIPTAEKSVSPRCDHQHNKNELQYLDDRRRNKSNIKSYHDGCGIPQNVKADIIRSILTDYNVEDYVHKFTSPDIVEIKLDPHNPETRPVRERLLRLMNSDVIKINDVHYMRQLSRKLQQSYVEDQQKLMEQLEEKERLRVRKLRIHGLIPDNSDQDSYNEHKPSSKSSSSSHAEQMRRRKSTRKSIFMINNNTDSIFTPLSNNYLIDTFTDILDYEPLTELGKHLLDRADRDVVLRQNRLLTMFDDSNSKGIKEYLKVKK